MIWTGTINYLEKLLLDSVGIRMEADVPVGAFLSGGIDSSLVVMFMQMLSSEPVRTYSIGFNHPGNEAEFAKSVADYLGTQHTELYVSPDLLLEHIPNLPDISDEPIGDTAVIPTYLVSRLARKSITVSLSGDGGDELFAGYPRYIWTKQYWERARKRVSWMPPLLRKGMMRIIREMPENVLSIFPYGSQLNEMANTLIHESPEDVYHYLIDSWRGDLTEIVGANPNWSVMSVVDDWPDQMDAIQRMVYLDLIGRLPDSIVSKVDRATMQMSLEARCPLMDYRMVEFAMKVPTDLKIKNGQGKWVLRQLLYRHIPKALVDRPKLDLKHQSTIGSKALCENGLRTCLVNTG
jgi:asparagine synthase (glutamine-hydrolysing)